jgi:zinc transporter, ZIP family
MDFWFALSLTFLAGIATVAGGLLATHKKLLNRGALAVALGFSAGAMLYVSFTDILGKSLDSFTELYSSSAAYGFMALSFFVGIGIMALADRLIPQDINLNEQEGVVQKRSAAKRALMHSGLFIGLALCLHNFPEGFLVFMTAYDDPNVGIAVAIALAIHNIPEGIAIAAPLYAATKSRLKSVGIAGLTGVAEPVGAVIGFLLLQNILTPNVFGWVFGVVAGMMVFICIDELLPAAKRYETNQRQTTYGFIAGMGVLAVSLTLLQ